MKFSFLKRIRKAYQKITTSIAFYPALIALGFLLLSIVMLEFDFSEVGKHFKASVSWIRLRDTDTARTIVSTIIGGIISLTVFSFSMVMILLNQTASQMSNRTLETMISNPFHQVVLGFYIGSIVYALSLLTTIRDIESGIYVPALSIYLLLLVTVTDILLFIYFLHYVTQQVKFETIIKRIHDKTYTALEKSCSAKQEATPLLPSTEPQIIAVPESDYFQGYSKKELIEFTSRHNITVHFLHPRGTYLLKDEPLMAVYSFKTLSKDDTNELLSIMDLYVGQPIEKNYFYGMHQLTEIAMKALSPGINDPQTGVLSLHALTDLYSYLLEHPLQTIFYDKEQQPRIHLYQRSMENIFTECFYPIWDYGKDDRYIQQAMRQMLVQLLSKKTAKDPPVFLTMFLENVETVLQKKKI